MSKLFIIIKQHKIAIIFAILVGIIYVTPHIVFKISLGDKYQGIPMMATANEDFYLARMQEIIDGHPGIGSSVFWEYKNRPALSPPIGEFFYAWPSLLLRVSLENTLIASRFVLPFILFLLIYGLIKMLTDQTYFYSKVNAIAGALFVLLGYDLIDYRSTWAFFANGMHLSSFGSFLLWSRPVNPIIGGIFLFTFLCCLLAVIQKNKHQKIAIIGAALALALAFGNYFFSWGIGLSVWFVLLLIYLLKRDFQSVKKILLIFLGAIILSSPYWYMAWQTSRLPLYRESALRDGLFLTHYPVANVLMQAVLAFYLLFMLWPYFKQLKYRGDKLELLKAEFKKTADWQWFGLAAILGSLMAYNQQIITGLTIWPYHFVQYTIPLAIIVLVVLFYNIIRKSLPVIWRSGVFILIGFLLIWGISNQVGAYNNAYSFAQNLQTYKPTLNWLNNQPKDSVVLVANIWRDERVLNNFIPAFTHCNVYISSWTYSIMPEERRLHNYLVLLRLKGLASGDIDKYLKDNRGEAVSYLFSNWKGLYGVKQFPDFFDTKIEERLKNLPEAYRQFLKKDFRTELNQYRLDYIASIGQLDDNTRKNLPGLKEVFRSEDFYIYEF